MALASAQARTIQTSIPEKIMGYPKQSLEKKNLFFKKYDEIRRLDGNYIEPNPFMLARISILEHFCS